MKTGADTTHPVGAARRRGAHGGLRTYLGGPFMLSSAWGWTAI